MRRATFADMTSWLRSRFEPAFDIDRPLVSH
jgi:hypothetical protein